MAGAIVSNGATCNRSVDKHVYQDTAAGTLVSDFMLFDGVYIYNAYERVQLINPSLPRTAANSYIENHYMWGRLIGGLSVALDTHVRYIVTPALLPEFYMVINAPVTIPLKLPTYRAAFHAEWKTGTGGAKTIYQFDWSQQEWFMFNGNTSQDTLFVFSYNIASSFDPAIIRTYNAKFWLPSLQSCTSTILYNDLVDNNGTNACLSFNQNGPAVLSGFSRDSANSLGVITPNNTWSLPTIPTVHYITEQYLPGYLGTH